VTTTVVVRIFIELNLRPRTGGACVFWQPEMKSARALLLWGDNSEGQIGQGDRKSRLLLVTLGRPHFGGAPVAMVACG